MNNQESGFVKGRVKGGIIALRGAVKILTTEHSIMVQMSLAVIITVIGFLVKLTPIRMDVSHYSLGNDFFC